ncbi:TPA: hypothetical protein I7E95_002516 [Vibrio cholerae]|nr:hypothetical protein [Vibrio cholerae]
MKNSISFKFLLFILFLLALGGIYTFFTTLDSLRNKGNDLKSEALITLNATSAELSKISEGLSELYVDCMWKTDHNKLLCLSNLKNLTDTETFEAMKGKVLNLNEVNEGESNVNKK